MNPNRPNGHDPLKQRLQRPMTPEERVLWMAKQQLPPGYTLLHVSEVENIGQGLNAEHRTRIALQKEIEACTNSLDAYWRTQPDLVNAVDQACFDARRFHRGVEHALTRLNAAEAFLKVLLSRPEIGPTVMIDVINEHNAVQATIAFLKAQIEARRDVIKATK